MISNQSVSIMDQESRRAHIRLPIKMKVKITSESYCTRQVVTKDFSDGGIFISDPELAKLDAGTLLEVQSDEGYDNAPILKARIAWTNSLGAGVEYLLDE
ncbi:MAG: PilZ domain-containing protein [Kangiellaceae bacterium]|jgi:PilZ domain